MAIDRRLAKKGRDEPFQALLDQGRYQVKLAQQHAPELADNNWAAAQTSALDADIVALDTDKNRQIDERAGAKQATVDEGTAITEAKALVNRIRNVARQVVRKHPDAGVTVDDFNSGGPLGRVASKISGYLARLQVPAAKLDQAFAPYLKNQVLSKLLADVRTKLDQASTSQEVDIASLPEDTAKVYETKGRILEQIEDLNAIAKNAFADAPETRAKFNKDILNRGRRKRPNTPPSPTPTPTPTP